MTVQVSVLALRELDRSAWEPLARAYKAFYNTPTSDSEYELAWNRLLAGDGVQGLGAFVGGQLVGFAHFLFHSGTWAPVNCYLQDLFTAPQARGQGVGRALIEAVADKARGQGAARYYWLTQESNQVAIALYEKLARYGGFIRFDYPLNALNA